MPITLDALRYASRQPGPLRKTPTEARVLGLRTAFLCHSHQDTDLVRGLLKLMDDAGWQIYVDWEDSAMPSEPDRDTALRIQRKIVDLHYFLFLATPNSMASRWCPWEIGYADGKKPYDHILVIPTSDSSGKYHGSEYLMLYQRIDSASGGAILGAFGPGKYEGIRLSSLA